MNISEFFVAGVPAPKGSTRSFIPKGSKTGKLVTLSDCRSLEGWENRVWSAAVNAGLSATSGRVDVVVTFFLPRPKYHFGKAGIKPAYASAHHLKTPDADKLLRAVLDALTGVAYVDDAQVVRPHPTKQYTDPASPLQSGALIRVIQYEEGNA